MDWRLISRTVTLFSIGAALAVALNLIWQFELPSWFLIPVLASSATLVGLLYPYVIGEHYADAPDTSKVLRCVAVSVGIYQATITIPVDNVVLSSLIYLIVISAIFVGNGMPLIQKIDFSSYVELVLTMGALAVGMWWLFDRSGGGLILSILFTLVSTAATRVVLQISALRLNDELFLYSRLWCIYFSGCITFGTIGRRLAASDSGVWGT